MPKIFAFQLVADALGVRYEEGKARWDQAQARLKRQKLQLPPTSRAKPPGARQHTPTLDPNDAPKALALVLKDPLEFFEKDEKLVWLRSKVQEAGGDPKTVDAQREVLLAEKAQREADAQSLGTPVYRIDGSIDTAKRAERIAQFQKSTATPAPVFLIQIKAGGVGLNLQSATRVYITCPAWNPATELQAICRAHRNGQTGKVWVKKLIYAEVDGLPSIEQSIIELQGHKSAVCADVLKDERLRLQLPTTLKGGVTARAVRKIFSV